MASETRHSSASKAEIRWIRSRHHCAAQAGVICPPKLSEHSRKSGRGFLQLTLKRSRRRVGFLTLSGCVKLAMAVWDSCNFLHVDGVAVAAIKIANHFESSIVRSFFVQFERSKKAVSGGDITPSPMMNSKQPICILKFNDNNDQ